MKTTTTIILLLLYYGLGAWAECNCTGVLLQGSDQLHCLEVVKGGTNAWSTADNLCSAKGGRLGFLSTDVYSNLVDYLKSVYSKPIFVATVVGSITPARYANMCPSNNYTTINSTFVGKIATSVHQCGFILSPNYQIEFYSCDRDADILCDIPLEKTDVCGMNNIPNTCSVTTRRTTVTGTTRSNANGTTPTTQAITTILNNVTTSTVTTRKPEVLNTTLGPIVTPPRVPAVTDISTVSTKTTRAPCTCPTCPPITYNNTTNSPNSGVCTKKCCDKEDWRLPWISQCFHWALFFLLLFLTGLLPLLLCICLHCVCNCCRDSCQIKQKFEPEDGVKQPFGPPTNSTVIAPVPMIDKMYDDEKINVLPPQPIDSTPAVIPDKIDTPMVGFGLISREVQIIHPEKPVMKDTGMNTDPWEPRISKKKFVPKKRFPSPEAYVIGVDDPAEEVNIEVNRSPSPNLSVGPKGDVEPPIVFMRNRAPEMPSSQPPELDNEPTHVPVAHSPKRFPSPPIKKRGQPATVINLTGHVSPTSDIEESKTNETPVEPHKAKQKFPSPPMKRKNQTESGNVPEVQVDPATPRAPVNTQNRFPSPPRSRSQEPSTKKPSLPMVEPLKERPSSRSPQSHFKPRSAAKSAEEPDSSFGIPTRTISGAPASSGGGMMQPPSVSLKAPKGKLGGAVRAGSNGNDVPPGWKPWSKGAKGSDNGHYLNND